MRKLKQNSQKIVSALIAFVNFWGKVILCYVLRAFLCRIRTRLKNDDNDNNNLKFTYLPVTRV